MAAVDPVKHDGRILPRAVVPDEVAAIEHNRARMRQYLIKYVRTLGQHDGIVAPQVLRTGVWMRGSASCSSGK